MSKQISEATKQSCFDLLANPVVSGARWTDETSYSRSDTERIPTVFRTIVGSLRISIIFNHMYYADKWIMNCFELGMREIELRGETAQEAAEAAIRVCKEKVRIMHDAFSKLG